MANWSTLKAAVANIIKTNGNQKITGQVLQNTLNSIINTVGENATFAGIAIPSTNPGSPDGPIFYFANSVGVYSNFDGIELENPSLIVLYNNTNGAWKSLKVYECLQELGNSEKFPLSQAGVTKSHFLNMGIDMPTDKIPYFLEGLLYFKLYPNFPYEEGKSYNIAYFYNHANNEKFLLQIVDNENNVVAQHYADAKTGIGIIQITSISTGIIVGEAVVNFDKVPNSFAKYNVNLVNGFGIPNELLTISAHEGWITPNSYMGVNLVNNKLTMNIPKGSYVYILGRLITLDSEWSVTDYTIKGIQVFVYDMSIKTFKFISPNELNSGQYVKCGQFNSYSQTIILNSTSYVFNGIEKRYNSEIKYAVALSNSKIWKNPPIRTGTNGNLEYPLYLAIQEMRIVGGDPNKLLKSDGTFKDIYLTNVQKWHSANETPNLRLNEPAEDGTVNWESGIVASTTETINGATRGLQTFIMNGYGIDIMITIDWSLLSSTNYRLTTEMPVNVSYLYHSYLKSLTDKSPFQPWWLNPTRDFDYSMIKELSLIGGRKDDLIDPETQQPYRIFLSFMRILTPDKGGSDYNILQIIKKVDDNPGVNNLAIATTNNNDAVNDEGILTTVTKGKNGTDLRFRFIIDYNKFISSGMNYNGEDLGATLELNTAYFIAQLEDRPTGALQLSNLNILCLGDSITEFKDSNSKGYVEYLAEISGANVFRGSIGGTRLSSRTDVVKTPTSATQAYAALDIVNVVKALCSQDWSTFDAGIEYVKDNSGDDNTAIADTLKSMDMSKVDIITVFGGTNDLTAGSTIGDTNSANIKEVCGAVNEMIKLIGQTYPHIKLYFFSPIVRYLDNVRDDEHWSDNWNNGRFPSFIETVGQCITGNHIPFCAWYWDLGWTKYNFSNYFRDNDGTHPYKGFYSLALRMNSFLVANRF
jgi:lysophospholipase L1-like esterase